MKAIKYSDKDFTYSRLPHNRKEMFFDVYKNNFPTILKGGALLLVFALPLLIFMIFMEYGKLGMTSDYYSAEELDQVLRLWDILVNLGGILLLFLFLVGLAGVLRVFRLLLWQEGIDFLYDFKAGVKENYPTMATISIFMSLLYLAAYFVSVFFQYTWLSFLPLILFILFLVPTYIWMLLLGNVYVSTPGIYIKNGFFFFSKTIGWSLLGVLLIGWPFFLAYIPLPSGLLTISIKYSIIIVALLFYYPAVILLSSLYSYSKFDQYLNIGQYPDYYRKGLYDLKDPGEESFWDEEPKTGKKTK